MPLIHNPGLPAIAFIQGSAILTLLVLYLLLLKSFSARFFRIWIAGWAVYACFGASRVVADWQGGSSERLLMAELSFVAGLLFFGAILDLIGRYSRLYWLWPVGTLGVVVLLVQAVWLHGPVYVQWIVTSLECALFLVAGWLLWRRPQRRGIVGVRLLAAALFLRGLHGIDQPAWPHQAFYLLRFSFNGLLEASMGVAMVVLVLEFGRARTEDLNEKLRRLTLITAAATQSFRLEEVLGEVLHHLVESLGASHGIVRLLDGKGKSEELVIRAAVGFSPRFLQQNARVAACEPWTREVLEKGVPFLVYAGAIGQEVRLRMKEENLAALVMVRVPGKEGPLGVLAIGSTSARTFQSDEVEFLVNVANLLGLTIQNVGLFEDVAKAQRQWVNTFDSITDFILVHDSDGCILRINRALAGRLGREPDALVGRLVREVLRRGEGQWSRCPYCEAAGGNANDIDSTLGGYFLISNSDFHDPAGQRLGTIHVLKSMLERREAETKFRTLFQNVQEGVFISTPEGRFVDFNDAFLHLLGYERREELLSVEDATEHYVDPADRDRLKRLLLEHGEVSNFEFELRRKDGETRNVLESSFATRDASGAVTAYEGFVLDITERKQAEQEIHRRNRELMALNSIAQTLSQSLALDDALALVVRQVVELFGVDVGTVYLLDEKTGAVKRAAAAGLRTEYARHFPAVAISPELIHNVRMARATVLSAKSLPLPEVFLDLQRKEGIQVAHLAILWAKDQIIGGLTVACRTMREFSGAELNLLAAVGNQIAATIDQSVLLEETRLAYENLRRTQEQLLQSEKMAAVGQLVSGVAHELNNPLTAIIGYSELLNSHDNVTARGADYVKKLHKQAQRTHRIVQNLLSFARQQKPERLPVQLNQILEETLVLREYDLKLNNIQVHREYDTDLPSTLADPHQLQQVFLNILNNAADAILEKSDRGEIWVRTALDAGRLLVEFTDSGAGVSEPHRVFDPFYTTKPVGKGTGLGLSICYGIVKEHGGEIQVLNSPQRGATFSILLPMLEIASQTGTEHLVAEECSAFGCVLLVDEQEAVLDLEQEILRSRCQAVHAVRTGREALEILERDQVDMVVTDLKLPGEISGMEIYEWVGRNRPDLARRLVFTTSNASGEDEGKLIEESGCYSVQKPFHIEEFLGALRRAVGATSESPVKR